MKIFKKVMHSLPIYLNDKTIIPKFIFGATVLILAVLSAMEHTDVLVEVLESQRGYGGSKFLAVERQSLRK